MNKRPTSGKKLSVAIAGAGPAGSSLAIRLASAGHRVTLIERETFPRDKLCGEFISPECLGHFSELGVRDAMMSSGGESIFETRFFSRTGRNFAVPSSAFGGPALSLSRSRMDEVLIRRVESAGAEVLEGARIADARVKDGIAAELVVADGSARRRRVSADLFVDATGRGSALTKLVERKLAGGAAPGTQPRRRSLAVGFKTHLVDSTVPSGVCEIYFFPGGYAGLSRVECGLANLCFLLSPAAARKYSGDAGKIALELVRSNRRAEGTLGSLSRANEWLAVSVNSFGERQAASAGNVISVGDAAAFIDPFTGSGMLMAMESASLLSEAVINNENVAAAAAHYRRARARSFRGRLRVCGALRWAAFMPVLPGAAITFLELSGRTRGILAGATRGRRATRA